jgi:2-polyprenyl-6-methoxyphenol hydroxylase-like FAD-dependent oxidoreductase
MKSIHILGGGLAGLSLGIGLRRRGVPVRISEAGHYPRHRVCGEFISGVGEGTLEVLGLENVFADAFRCSSVSWRDERGAFFTGSLPVAAFGISRHVLDARLAERFQELGGELACGVRTVQSNGEGEILATGRKPVCGKWVGIKKHYKHLELEADLEMQSLSCGYIGFSKVGPDTVNICGLLRADAVASLPKGKILESILESQSPAWRERLQKAVAVAESDCAVAGFQPGWQVDESSGVLSLGDRTAMIPPFTGHGMSMAFEGAAVILEEVERYAAGSQSWDDCRGNARACLRRAFAWRMRTAGCLHPILLSFFGRKLLSGAGRASLLPFQTLFQCVR